MTKLWARLYLWWNGWRVKHGAKRSAPLREFWYCPECDKTVEILRGKQR